MKNDLFRIGILGKAKVTDFKFVLEQEFDSIELSTNPGAIDNFIDSISTINRWRKYFPVPISAIGYFAAEYQRDPREFNNLIRLMDACNHLGAGIVHVGTGSKTTDVARDIDWSINFFDKAINEAKKRKLKLALYTCEVSNFSWDPKFWTQLFKDLPDLWLKYDPSHAYHTPKRDYITEIKNWGGKIIHFHAKGGYFRPDGTRDPMGDPPPGEDQIDWSRLLQTLLDINYNGVLSIEMHADRFLHDEAFDALKKSRDYLKQVNCDLLKRQPEPI